MATPRRSARIAAQPTVTWYSVDGYTKEDRVLPPYRGLTEQQCNQLDKDGTRLQNCLIKIKKSVLPGTIAMYTIDFFLYIKRHPLILLRVPRVRASTLTMLRNAHATILWPMYTWGQAITMDKLYHEIVGMMCILPQNPLYLA
jgi:hypothetical protein